MKAISKALNDTKYIYCKWAGLDAKRFISNAGFTLLKGSVISENTANSFEARSKSYCKLRSELDNYGTIVDRVFLRDYEFSEPSAASAVILGRTSNGNMDWIDENGVKLKEM